MVINNKNTNVWKLQ